MENKINKAQEIFDSMKFLVGVRKHISMNIKGVEFSTHQVMIEGVELVHDKTHIKITYNSGTLMLCVEEISSFENKSDSKEITINNTLIRFW